MNINQLSKEKIFSVLKDCLKDYLEEYNLNYSSVEEKYIEREIAPVNQSYELIYDSNETTQKLTFNLVRYPNSSSIFIWIDSVSGKGLLSLKEYFVKHKKLSLTNEYFEIEGNQFDLEFKLNAFFDWLTSVTDAQLINILQGKDWVDIPFDWGGYR